MRSLALAGLAVLVASLLVPASAEACGGGCAQLVEFLGWTKDSRFAVYRQQNGCAAEDTHGDEEATSDGSHSVVLGVAIEARSGAVHRYLLQLDGELPPKEAAEYRALQGAPAFEKWLAAHPLAPKYSDWKSPDGAKELLLDHEGRDLWDEDQEGTNVLAGDGEPGSVTAFPGVRARGSVFLAEESWQSGECTGMPAGTVTGFWSPDSLRVAWVKVTGGCMGHRDESFALQAAGPSVQVLADKAVTPARLDAAYTALEKAGFPPIAGGPTRNARTRTVVYFAPHNETRAKAAATALPGATVEPLTWKSPHDLVVALAPR